MSQLLSALRRKPKLSGLLTMLVAAIAVPAVIFAWGPDRPTYTMANPAPHVTFNSITDNPTYGDEREFVTIKNLTTGGSYTNNAKLIPGHTYKVQIYVHNDASRTLNNAKHDYKGVALDTTVRTALPKVVNGNGTVDGFVSASNATPKVVYDTAKLTSDKAVNIEYVSGSAMLHTWKQQTQLSSQIFGDGVLVGSGDKEGKDLSGRWLGCIEYAGGVTYEFKVTEPTVSNFEVEKMASKHKANSWSENYQAKPGETVDFRIKYSNTGTAEQRNVVVKDNLPAGLSYVKGTTRLFNSQTPASGKVLSDNLTGNGVNIGHYAPKAWAYVAFSAKVAKNDDLAKCQLNTLKNVATVKVGDKSKSDDATVTVDKKCVTPPPAPEPEPEPTPEPTPEPEMVKVCDTKTGDIVKVTEEEAKSDRYAPVNSDKCKDEVPAEKTPAELPQTGLGLALNGLAGIGTLTAAGYYYVTSRRL